MNFLSQNLRVGEKFFMTSSSGERTFGIRSKCRDVEPCGCIWFTNLETGEVIALLDGCHVQKIDSFIELVVHYYEADIKPVESIDQVRDFLGIDLVGDIWD